MFSNSGAVFPPAQWNFLRAYVASKVSCVLGDLSQAVRVASVLGRPLLLSPAATTSAQPQVSFLGIYLSLGTEGRAFQGACSWGGSWGRSFVACSGRDWERAGVPFSCFPHSLGWALDLWMLCISDLLMGLPCAVSNTLRNL